MRLVKPTLEQQIANVKALWDAESANGTPALAIGTLATQAPLLGSVRATVDGTHVATITRENNRYHLCDRTTGTTRVYLSLIAMENDARAIAAPQYWSIYFPNI